MCIRDRSNSTWVYNYHTTLNLSLIDTTEKQTYVITGFTLCKNLTEHLNTSNSHSVVGGNAYLLHAVHSHHSLHPLTGHIVGPVSHTHLP